MKLTCYRCGEWNGDSCGCADGQTVFHGDCRAILPLLPQFDLVLTDPPYGLGARWTGGTWGANPMYADAKEWDVAPDEATIQNVIGAGKNAIIWGGNYFQLPPCRGFLLWVKNPSMETMSDAEYAWTTFDHVSKALTEQRNKDGKRSHPTQKPQHLMKWSILFAEKRAGKIASVLDPYCGSGTTLLAAKLAGIPGTGIEINEKYCEIAANRLRQNVLNFGGAA
jgi:site-specific DNA-methyltransferase (adenine-specific)